MEESFQKMFVCEANGYSNSVLSRIVKQWWFACGDASILCQMREQPKYAPAWDQTLDKAQEKQGNPINFNRMDCGFPFIGECVGPRCTRFCLCSVRCSIWCPNYLECCAPWIPLALFGRTF